MPAFQGLPGCTRGNVLNRLITHQGRRVAKAQWRFRSLHPAFIPAPNLRDGDFPGLGVIRQIGAPYESRISPTPVTVGKAPHD